MGVWIEFKHNINAINRRDDRGLRTRMVEKEGKYFLIFENNTAYTIQVGHIKLHDGSPEWGRNMEFKWHIEPLSVRRMRINPVSQHKITPFDRVSILNTEHQGISRESTLISDLSVMRMLYFRVVVTSAPSLKVVKNDR